MVTVGTLKELGSHVGHMQFTAIAAIFAHSVAGLNFCFYYRFRAMLKALEKTGISEDTYRATSRKFGRIASFVKWFSQQAVRRRNMYLFIAGVESVVAFITVVTYNMEVPEDHFRNAVVRRKWKEQAYLVTDDRVVFGYDYKLNILPNLFLLTCLIGAGASACFNVLLSWLMAKVFGMFGQHVTRETFRTHRRIVIGLVVQTFLPIVFFIIPLGFTFTTTILLLRGVFSENKKYIPVILLAIHPSINACVTLGSVTPFRRAIQRYASIILNRKKQNANRRTTLPAVTSVYISQQR